MFKLLKHAATIKHTSLGIDSTCIFREKGNDIFIQGLRHHNGKEIRNATSMKIQTSIWVLTQVNLLSIPYTVI